MISKKHLLLYFIVFYCVNVGVIYSHRCQESSYNRKECENVIFNVVLLKSKIGSEWDDESVVGRRERRRVNSKMRNNKQKGRNILISIENKFIRYKRSTLVIPNSQRKSNRIGSLIFFQILKLRKITRKFFKSLSVPNIVRSVFLQIINSNKYIRNRTIEALLIMGTVEINPGPASISKESVKIVTYNCNGLGNRLKRNRILSKASCIAEKGGIVMLQETHITNEQLIRDRIKQNFWLNPFSSNSAGVLTVMSSDYKEVEIVKDNRGRQLMLVVEKDEEKFMIVNVYCPNDHKKSLDFIEEVYSKILEINYKYPDLYIILGGDFNSCASSKDFLNRTRTKSEDELTKAIKQNNEICNLFDSYSYIGVPQGFTWNRGNCYSRLDYIYLSNTLSNRIISSKVDWAFDRSDHAAVITEIKGKVVITKGPGIVKVNASVLKNNKKKEEIRDELIFLIQQIPQDWNGHKKLDFLKVIIRSTLAKFTGLERSEDKVELENLEGSLNDIVMLKQKVMSRLNLLGTDQQSKINKIDLARNKIIAEIDKLRNKMDKEKEFYNTAKWFEYGEKSNKYFLNLNKHRNKQKIISEIRDGDKNFEGQNNVIQGVRAFYENLYSKEAPNITKSNDPQFFSLCPKLSEKDRLKMDENISLNEMYRALLQCKDSAPGLDGIPYSVYKTYWNQVGFILKEAWDYSIKIGEIPESHKESVITILPKDGKDTRDIKNWRPITLTNCDAKIITKALAMRLNPMLNSIIHVDPSQTAYVPGRSVMDNLRSKRFLKDYCKKRI